MNKGIQKAIWLHICTEGGKWSSLEISEQFKIPRQLANVLMHNMATRSRLLHRCKADGKTAFAVTGACAIPIGVTMDELNGLQTVVQLAEAA